MQKSTLQMFWKNLKIFHMLKKLRRNVQHSPRFVGCVVSYGVKFVSTAGGAVCQQDPAAGGGARPAAGHQQDHGRAADTGAGDTWEARWTRVHTWRPERSTKILITCNFSETAVQENCGGCGV